MSHARYVFSTVSVAAILDGVTRLVTTLALPSTLTLPPPDRLWRSLVVEFLGYLVGKWPHSQLSELQNARVLLEEARGLSRNLAYHRRARLEARIGEALDEVDRQIQELRADRG
jgi:hypothetical protein